MIKLEKKGRRIVLTSSQPITGLKTAVPGAYQTARGVWTVPLSLESCKLLRQKYGKQLELGNELRRWATGVVESRAYMNRLASAKNAKLRVLPRVAPKLAKAMNRRKYQRVGVRFVADNAATLVADDPGLGKTLIAMGGILEAEIPGPYLIVAPKTAADTVWRREIMRWLPPGHRAITLPQFRYQREHKINLTRYGPKTWLIVHPEIVLVASHIKCSQCGHLTNETYRQSIKLQCGHVKGSKPHKIVTPSYPKLFEIEWGAIVVDESHESLIRRTGIKTQRRRGLEMLKTRVDGIRIAMSGTPFDSKPHQLWGTLNWLDPQQYSAFHRWAELYWQKGGYSGFEIGEFRKDREKLLWDSLTAVALRRTKAEVATDLPPKIHVGSRLIPADPHSPVGVWLEMDGPQLTAYQQIEKLSIAELESGRLEPLGALAELTRLKQLATCYGDIKTKMVWDSEAGRQIPKDVYFPKLPSNKFNWIAESLEEWGYPNNPLTKVVIVSFYTGILEAFSAGVEAHFKTKPSQRLCTAITGKTPGNKRRGIIDRFNQSDNELIMMLNVKAGGTAITIDSADRMIFISETRIPDQQKQAEDRIHRISNPRTCMYYYLRSLGTVDVGTALVNQQMIADTHRLLDARRGVDYMQQIMELSH
jgi:SNF2 family DNA or RNA helicase